MVLEAWGKAPNQQGGAWWPGSNVKNMIRKSRICVYIYIHIYIYVYNTVHATCTIILGFDKYTLCDHAT